MKIFSDIKPLFVGVGGIPMRQWRDLCNQGVKQSDKSVKLKIQRAFELGKVVYVYAEGHYIIRFYSIDLLVVDGVVYCIWKDLNNYFIKVSKTKRDEWDKQHDMPKMTPKQLAARDEYYDITSKKSLLNIEIDRKRRVMTTVPQLIKDNLTDEQFKALEDNVGIDIFPLLEIAIDKKCEKKK